MCDPNRCFLPEDRLERRPQFSYLVAKGLPSPTCWRHLRVGPEHCFEFELLARGGTRYEEAVVERSGRYFPALSNMLRIGTYTYSFCGVQLQSDVCAQDGDGALWIVDLNHGSINTHGDACDTFWERIPISYRFLNSGGEQFEKCLLTYLEYVERARDPTKDGAGASHAALLFEDFVRQTDPQVLDQETSFWDGAIGEMLGPF